MFSSVGDGDFLLRYALILCCGVNAIFAQDVGFTVYPQQVLTGSTYQIAWRSNGQAVTINLVRAGQIEETLLTTGSGTGTFQWTVEDDADAGTDYTLDLVVDGQTYAAPVWMIEDEDGLVVSGTTITAPAITAAVTGNPTAISYPIQTGTTTTSSATSTPTSNNDSPPQAGEQLSGGAIAGIVVGAVASLFIVAGLIMFYRRRRRLAHSGDGSDTIKSFLALRGDGTERIAHGTSPEFKEVPGDESFVGGAGKRSTVSSTIRNSTMSNPSEVHGDSFVSQSRPAHGTFEADGRPFSAPLHELPGDDVPRRPAV